MHQQLLIFFFFLIIFYFIKLTEVESALARKHDQSRLSHMWPLVVFQYSVFQLPYMERYLPKSSCNMQRRGGKKMSPWGQLAVICACVRQLKHIWIENFKNFESTAGPLAWISLFLFLIETFLKIKKRSCVHKLENFYVCWSHYLWYVKTEQKRKPKRCWNQHTC